MRILIAGDFCPNHRVATEIKENRGNEVLSEVLKLTKDADYSILNFECPVTDGNYQPITKIGPHLKASKDALVVVKNAGFNMLTLANNHIMDYGKDGLYDTLRACSDLGLEYVGVGTNSKEASNLKYITIDNKLVAFVNCCEHEFSIAENNTPGANPLNPINQYYSIQEAKQKADFIIVIIHGGHEHCQLPSLRMIDIYRFFIDAGADAVINHHQHCYSGYEYYKDRPIVYGLGNFCFDWDGVRDTIWNEGFIAELFITDEEIKLICHPYTQCNKTPRVKLLDDRTSFDTNISKLNHTISNREELTKKLEAFYEQKEELYKLAFEPYTSRLFRKLYIKHLLPSFLKGKKKNLLRDFVECESHSDIVKFILRR